MITKLIKVLQEIGLKPLPEDLADMLWLSRYLDKPDLSSEKDSSGEQEQTKKESESKTPDQSTVKDNSTASTKSNLYPNTKKIRNQINTTGMKPTPFKAAAGQALPGKLAISRSLRPLMKKVPSRKSMAFDEQTTIHNIAESDTWIPIFKPKRSPWLDIVLILDESPSMLIWYETISELKELLEHQGAFRNVQLWGFISDEKEKVHLHEGLCFDCKQQKLRHPKELIDPTNRRLILIISDCISKAWHDGTISKFLKIWNENSRVSILQMLPHYLWEQTHLKNAEIVYFQNRSSSTVNSKLEIEPSPFGMKKSVSNTLKLPVITLEDRSIFPWAKSLTGIANVWIPGVLLKLFPGETCEDDRYEKKQSASNMSEKDQLKYFMATASPEAQKLLRCLAPLPLTLSVIRLAQKVILPDTKQVHLAELFLSGLIKQSEPKMSYALNNDLSFEFKDGIQELLISSQPVHDTIDALSVYIESYSGGSQSLRALVANPNDFSKSLTDNLLSPFAQISTNVLRLLGGKYIGLAEKIEHITNTKKSKPIEQNDKITQPKRTKVFTLPDPDTDYPVFFADVSDSLRLIQKRAMNDLQAKGVYVIDENVPPPYDIEGHDQHCSRLAASSLLSVHLFDQYPGRIIDNKQTYAMKQLQICLKTSASQLIWMPKYLRYEDIEDKFYHDFLIGLEKLPETYNDCEYVRGDRDVITIGVIDKIFRLNQNFKNPYPSDQKKILIDAHEKDYLYAAHLNNYFIERDISIIMNPNNEKSTLDFTQLKNHLKSCNALIFVYGEVTQEFIVNRIFTLMKMIIETKATIPTLAIFFAPPKKEKEIQALKKIIPQNIQFLDNTDRPHLKKEVLKPFFESIDYGSAT